MANQYFSYLPDFEYVSRLSGSNISDYVRVKNLFKRTKVNETIFGDLTNFTKYKIIGDERPDQVAFKIYGDSNLDWLIMLTNNILNYQNEWPMPSDAFFDYLLSKYGTEEKMFSAHHYETQEVRDQGDNLIVPAGLQVDEDFSITYRDPVQGKEVIASEITDGITNEQFETRLQNERRQIYVLRSAFLGIVLDDVERIKDDYNR